MRIAVSYAPIALAIFGNCARFDSDVGTLAAGLRCDVGCAFTRTNV